MKSNADLDQARRKVLHLRRLILRENEALQAAAMARHDRMNHHVRRLRSEGEDSRRAYLLACQERGGSAQALGILRAIRKTIPSLR